MSESFPDPHFLRKNFLSRRQINGYTVGDGISADNIVSIEANVKKPIPQFRKDFL